MSSPDPTLQTTETNELPPAETAPDGTRATPDLSGSLHAALNTLPLDPFQRDVITLRYDGVTFPDIATQLRCSEKRARYEIARLPVELRPTPLQVKRATRDARINALFLTGLSQRNIAKQIPCDPATVRSVLAKVLAPVTSTATAAAAAVVVAAAPILVASPSPPSDPADPMDPQTQEVLLLRRQGLSIKKISAQVGLSTHIIGKILSTHKNWNTSTKRDHEDSIFTVVQTLLPTPPSGIAIALTSDQLPLHLDVLERVVTRLVAIERVPGVFTRMLTSLSRPFPLPLSLHLGDFWDIARQQSDPIAFLDYDGMGALPARLQAHLAALAPRFTTPAIIRLTCSMAHRDCLAQIPQAIHALQHIPGHHLTRLDMHSTPSRHGQTAMATLIAVLAHGDAHDSPLIR